MAFMSRLPALFLPCVPAGVGDDFLFIDGCLGCGDPRIRAVMPFQCQLMFQAVFQFFDDGIFYGQLLLIRSLLVVLCFLYLA